VTELRIYSLQSGALSGVENMALDEALLETLRIQPDPVVLVRTYLWREPTLSLGVNQQARDVRYLLEHYGSQDLAIVRRPTGGRAILHGEDISYAFVTNEAGLLKQRLKDSYCVFAKIFQAAVAQLSLPVQTATTAGERDYLRSPVCFETQTPSDLCGQDGKKLSGSAQLRRAGGLLQHGSAFLAPHAIQEPDFSPALFAATAEAFGLPIAPYPPEAFIALAPIWKSLQAQYAQASGEILDSVSTSKGSHLTPDSP
jgi:lipoate-protein ligase A